MLLIILYLLTIVSIAGSAFFGIRHLKYLSLYQELVAKLKWIGRLVDALNGPHASEFINNAAPFMIACTLLAAVMGCGIFKGGHPLLSAAAPLTYYLALQLQHSGDKKNSDGGAHKIQKKRSVYWCRITWAVMTFALGVHYAPTGFVISAADALLIVSCVVAHLLRTMGPWAESSAETRKQFRRLMDSVHVLSVRVYGVLLFSCIVSRVTFVDIWLLGFYLFHTLTTENQSLFTLASECAQRMRLDQIKATSPPVDTMEVKSEETIAAAPRRRTFRVPPPVDN